MSSEDGDDESEVGIGTGIGLPVMLKNYIIGALDRLEIVAKDIDVQIDGNLPADPSADTSDDELASAAINLHVEQVSIDGVASGTPEVKTTPVQSSSQAPILDTRDGKRRMRVENICARLISDPESFASLSRVSRPSSPADTRSDISASQKSNSPSSVSGQSSELPEDDHRPRVDGSQYLTSPARSTHAHQEDRPLEASILSTDEDRFADAAVDDDDEDKRSAFGGLERSEELMQSRQSAQNYEFGSESSLFGDDGLLDYAVDNGLLHSRYDGADNGSSSLSQQELPWSFDGTTSSHQALGPHNLAATAPSPHTFPPEESFSEHRPISSSEPNPSSKTSASSDTLDSAKHAALEHATPEVLRRDSSSSSGSSAPNEDLAQSKVFTHEEAESMYLSAMSAAPTQPSRQLNIPGGWDAAFTSSKGTAPEELNAIPPVMTSSIILPTPTDVDDGCETPRPGSRASVISPVVNPLLQARSTEETKPTAEPSAAEIAPESFADNVKIAKPFFSIDNVNVWFPLDLSGAEPPGMDESAIMEDPLDRMQATTEFGDESIFRDMPGSFSFYAESSASRRRKSSSETAEARRPNLYSRNSKAEKITPVPVPTPPPRRTKDLVVEVEVGTVCGQVDISAGRMMFQIAQRLLAILGNSNTEVKPKQNPQGQPKKPLESSIKVSVEQVSLAWLERLVAESVTGAGHGQPPFQLEHNSSEAILWINLKALQMTGRSKGKESVTKLNIGKCALGALHHEIISFEPGSRSRRSMHTGDSLEHDIQVELRESSDRRLHMATRPIKVLLDLQKLDDALGSFGGFSGVLELGNSITSNQTLPQPPSPPAPQRPRGVHFGNVPPPTIAAPDSGVSLKVSIRCGDVSFHLKGKTCAVHVQTSAVKMVIRGSNFRLQITDIQIAGPYYDVLRDEPAFITEIKDFSATFLFSPEELDLTRLLSIITPSKDKYENDSDILIDTLLRQRQKGSVIRINVAGLGVRVSDLACIETFQNLGIELARLSTVTKYLPEDDRPGILTLGTIKQFEGKVMVNDKIGFVNLTCFSTQFAHVGIPPLFAVEVGKIALNRGAETLIDGVAPLRPLDELPMLMARIIGDEMEPTFRVKMFNMCLEYRVSTIMAALGLSDDGTVEELVVGMASSVATITGNSSPKTLSRQSSASSETSSSTRPLHIEVLIRDCALGLNPRKVPSKGLFVLTDTRLSGQLPKKGELSASLELRKASILIIDDVNRLDDATEPPQTSAPITPLRNRQIADLERSGFVSLSSISAAKALVRVFSNGEDQQAIDIEFKNDLFVLETCADSTQTLIGILNGLSPPMPPSTAERYRTVVPFQTMMDSFSGDAFISAEEAGDEFLMDDADRVDDEVPTNLEFVGSFYNPDSIPSGEDIGDSMLEADDLHSLATPPSIRQRGAGVLLESFQEQYEVAPGEQEFDFDDNYFGSNSESKGTARKWDSTKNQYKLSNEFKASGSPLKVRVRDVQIIWNLFDGYDWPNTRNTVAQAVENVEQRAEERRHRKALRLEEDEPNVVVEEDFLFNSVWISIPVNEEKGALYKKINHDVDDLVSETGSYATTTTASQATARQRTTPKSRRRKLKLERSRHKKITFELRGIDVDLVVYPPDTDETQSSVNVRVRDFEIFDHVPSSTWRKFATCLIEPSKREMNRPMINLELLTVKPVQDLAASEMVLRVRTCAERVGRSC
jgi:autophagy-related protein 2